MTGLRSKLTAFGQLCDGTKCCAPTFSVNARQHSTTPARSTWTPIPTCEFQEMCRTIRSRLYTQLCVHACSLFEWNLPIKHACGLPPRMHHLNERTPALHTPNHPPPSGYQQSITFLGYTSPCCVGAMKSRTRKMGNITNCLLIFYHQVGVCVLTRVFFLSHWFRPPCAPLRRATHFGGTSLHMSVTLHFW